MKFKVGDKVKLNPKVTHFKWGKAFVNYDEIGEVIEDYGDTVVINFPDHNYWHGVESELIPAEDTNITIHHTGDICFGKNLIDPLKITTDFKSFKLTGDEPFKTFVLGEFKEEKEMKLLEIYEQRKLEKINADNESEIEKILKNDAIHNAVDKFKEELEKQYCRIYIAIDLNVNDYTEETRDKLNKLDEETKRLKDDLHKEIDEIKAHLDICETYDQKMNVLIKYEVINAKTKALNV